MRAAVSGSRRATGIAAVGHGLVFLGFLQPWVAGQFGARERLSGLDLVRLTDGMIGYGLAGDALALPITRIALIAVPVAAANALLLLGLGYIGLIKQRHAHHLALALTIPAAAITVISLTLLLITAREGGIIDGPAFGLFIMAVGASLAIGAWRLAIDRSAHTASSEVAPDPPTGAHEPDTALPEA